MGMGIQAQSALLTSLPTSAFSSYCNVSAVHGEGLDKLSILTSGEGGTAIVTLGRDRHCVSGEGQPLCLWSASNPLHLGGGQSLLWGGAVLSGSNGTCFHVGLNQRSPHPKLSSLRISSAADRPSRCSPRSIHAGQTRAPM